MEANQLIMKQSLPLDAKVKMTERRIIEWHNHYGGQVYVAFSGGKDSTVLLHLARSLFPDVPAVFCDTGLEFPEIRDFVKTIDNVTWLKPKMTFKQVIDRYGYPVISKEQSQFLHEIRTTKSAKLKRTRLEGNKAGRGKVAKKWRFVINAPFKVSHKCCDVMKKEPSKRYEKETGRMPMLGTMAAESQLRRQLYLRDGCNGFDAQRPTSRPLSFWTDDDVWEYIKDNHVNYSEIYDMGEDRTGCMFCAFGCHKDNPNRFQRMEKTHPSQYRYCMDNLGMQEVLKFLGIPTEDRQLEFDFTQGQQ